ncbi:hypothetical protein SNEBB_006164 [Seison nebaliae]|nr:hypothetical protein SNEBB_006164 [Seison nebaliae]
MACVVFDHLITPQTWYDLMVKLRSVYAEQIANLPLNIHNYYETYSNILIDFNDDLWEQNKILIQTIDETNFQAQFRVNEMCVRYDELQEDLKKFTYCASLVEKEEKRSKINRMNLSFDNSDHHIRTNKSKKRTRPYSADKIDAVLNENKIKRSTSFDSQLTTSSLSSANKLPHISDTDMDEGIVLEERVRYLEKENNSLRIRLTKKENDLHKKKQQIDRYNIDFIRLSNKILHLEKWIRKQCDRSVGTD